MLTNGDKPMIPFLFDSIPYAALHAQVLGACAAKNSRSLPPQGDFAYAH